MRLGLGLGLIARGGRPSLALPLSRIGAQIPQPKRWADATTWQDTSSWSDVA